MSEIDRVHDILTDLLCSCMIQLPYIKPKIGDWCFETTSCGLQNRDCRIGILKQWITDTEFVTETIGGKEIHWTNAHINKIPDNLLRKE